MVMAKHKISSFFLFIGFLFYCPFHPDKILFCHFFPQWPGGKNIRESFISSHPFTEEISGQCVCVSLKF